MNAPARPTTIPMIAPVEKCLLTAGFPEAV